MRWIGSVAWTCALSACVYVGRQDFEDRRELIDEDGDGVPYAEDCNDRNALQSPDIEEIPYDGIDNDCAQDGDLIDADGDGYPGVLQADYLGTVYPEVFRGLPLDCADDPSVFPFAALISPAPDNPDVPYDGLDGGCDRSNDFDADGDGFMPAYVRVDGERVDVRVAFAAYQERWGLSREEAEAFVAPAGGLDDPAAFADCDDTDAALFPGNGRADVLYDGIDENCDGVNEFDGDGDGFVPPQYEAVWPAYLARHFAGGPPSFPVPAERLFEDCLDEPHPDFPGLDPADVRPSVPGDPVVDTPYDGIDTDCARDNDFDADGDGFVAAGTDSALVLDYIADWAISEAEQAAWLAANPDARLVDGPGLDDCDDDDPQVWPGAIETFASDTDRDCNGALGAGTLVFGQTAPGAPSLGFSFQGAAPPELARLADTFLLFVTANQMVLEEGEELLAAGVAIPVPLAATAQRYQVPVQADYPRFKESPQAVFPLIDVAVDPVAADIDDDGTIDPRVAVAVIEDDPDVDNTLVSVSWLRWLSATGGFVLPQFPIRDPKTTYAATDLEVGFDDAGDLYGIGCGTDGMAGAIHAVRAIGNPPYLSDLQAVPGEVCYVDGRPRGDVPVQVCAAGSCAPYVVDDALASWLPDGLAALDPVTRGDEDDHVLGRVANGVATVEVFGNAPIAVLSGLTGAVEELDAHRDGSDLFVAGVLDDAGAKRVWVERRGAAVDQVQIPLDAAQLANRVVDGIAVYGDTDRIAVAIRATGVDGAGVIGWVFMNP